MDNTIKCSNCTNNNVCSRCGECCTPFIPITQKECERIKKYIKEHDIRPTEIREGNNIYLRCPFYDSKNKKCNVYQVRPEVCKKFICSNNEKIIDDNRKYYDARADINGNTKKLTPMDLLFYDRLETLFYYIQWQFNPKSEKQLIEILCLIGRTDIAKEIIKKNITITWSGDKEC